METDRKEIRSARRRNLILARRGFRSFFPSHWERVYRVFLVTSSLTSSKQNPVNEEGARNKNKGPFNAKPTF